MKARITMLMAFAAITVLTVKAQDEWEPQTHITGYLNALVEYTDLDVYKDHSTGVGLSEAGFLASYKPLEKLEVKGTLVYTHHIKNLQELVVEAYGIYSFSDKLKVGAGRFLAPLSPVNTYFYAPLNISASLPMLVSHHIMVPQSISGFQVAGGFGSDLQINYNVTYGTYDNIGHPKNGILGILGQEEVAPLDVNEGNTEYLLGGTARLAASYNGMLSLGLNYFDGTQASILTGDPISGSLVTYDAKKHSFGVDAHLTLGGLKVNAEYWMGKQESNDAVQGFDPSKGPEKISAEMSAYYVEAMYEIGMFTPYIRYDFVEDVKIPPLLEAPTAALSLGLAIRPIYETLFKLEYRSVNMDYSGIAQDGLPAAGIPGNDFQTSYNHLLFSTVISF